MLITSCNNFIGEEFEMEHVKLLPEGYFVQVMDIVKLK